MLKHPIDLLIVLIMVYSLWQGYRTGLLRSFLFLVGLLTATFVSLSLYSRGGEFLTRDFSIPHPWAEFLSFSLIWIAISSLFNGIGLVLKKITKFLFISWLDNLGGALLGFGKGIFVISLILVSLTRIPLSASLKESIRNSELAPYFLKITPLLYYHVVRIFKNPNSQRYLKWRDDVKGIYQDFVPNLNSERSDYF